jgi:3-oxoacyl-[acyl-carrier protein] reductase
MRQDKQHAVITGGTGSLGGALSCVLEAGGFCVASPGSRELDVRDEIAVKEYFRDRPVDLLVCAAGVVRDAPLARTSPPAWDEVWNVNYTGSLLCAETVIPGMAARRSGHIIFVSSFSAIHPPPGQVTYAAAKAALLGLTSDLAVRHGSSNIRVNAVLPGFMDTAMTALVSDRRRTEVLRMHALGRFNTCENAAKFICFLHREMPDTSGQVFCLDSRPEFR